MLLGAVAIVIVSLPLFKSGSMTPFVPMPLHMVIMGWVLSYASLLVLPLIYVTEVKLLGRIKIFGQIVFIIILAFAAISIWYFLVAWDYGIQWQGKSHTIIVAIENFVSFIFLFILAYLGIIKKSKKLQYAANLLLFLTLSWCAFPYLGELP